MAKIAAKRAMKSTPTLIRGENTPVKSILDTYVIVRMANGKVTVGGKTATSLVNKFPNVKVVSASKKPEHIDVSTTKLRGLVREFMKVA